MHNIEQRQKGSGMCLIPYSDYALRRLYVADLMTRRAKLRSLLARWNCCKRYHFV